MKKLLMITVAGLLFTSFSINAQNADEEALKKIAFQETEVFMKKDSVTWKSLFVQDKNTYRSHVYFDYNDLNIGWDSVNTRVIGFMRQSTPTTTYKTLNHANFNIALSDNVAWVSFDQVFKGRNNGLPDSYSKEFRTFEKVNGEWKISAIESININSFKSPDPSLIEYVINSSGYSFLKNKKTKEALEVFTTNVALYPNEWNTYDSLGEAYAVAGDKKLAIENYEKSIKLNPKNDNGIAMLKKLKAN